MHSWEGDPRPEPVPEYGAIRPGPNLKLDQSIDPESASWRVLFAVAAGIMLAGFFATGTARAAFDQVASFLSLHGKRNLLLPQYFPNTRSRTWTASPPATGGSAPGASHQSL